MDLNMHSHASLMAHYNPRRIRTVLDPIHSHIEFDEQIFDIIDTEEFQRLRNIKQLGLSYLVFPSGVHTRFEHSIGTAFLAKKQIKTIFKRQPQLKDEESDMIIRNITIAGLCHDLGHGPFSHFFDNLVIKRINPFSTWKHEQASVMMFESLVENNNEVNLEKDDIQMIKDLIKGEIHESYEKKWIFDIVANQRNSIDVDKIDYLLRDSYHLGVKDIYFDYKNLIKQSRAINDSICYPSKECTKLYDLFLTRYRMYKGVYLNRVTQGMELMICDALVKANNVYKLEEIIYNPKEYLHCTDYIIEEIERSKNSALLESQSILKRLKKRDIYKYVGEILFLDDSDNKIPKNRDKIKLDIVSCQKNEGKDLDFTIDDIHILIGSINFGLQNKNPLDHIKFYNKGNETESFSMAKREISFCLPINFNEFYLRLYVTNKRFVRKASDAFNKYQIKFLNLEPGKALFSRIKFEDEILENFNDVDKKRKLNFNEVEIPNSIQIKKFKI